MPWPPETVDVRGCQFFNSVYRELYFTEKISSLLQSNGLVSGNRALAVWKYEFPADGSKGLQNEHADKIDKYCGLMYTLGDRRLTTHLFQGLETLVKRALHTADPALIDESVMESLLEEFRAKGRVNEQKQEVNATWKCKIFKQQKLPVYHH